VPLPDIIISPPTPGDIVLGSGAAIGLDMTVGIISQNPNNGSRENKCKAKLDATLTLCLNLYENCLATGFSSEEYCLQKFNICKDIAYKRFFDCMDGLFVGE
jgi:hypothetical protein